MSRTNKENIIDKIIDSLPADNNELYIEHQPGANAFTLKREDGK